MLWRSASLEPQRLMPRGEVAISVVPNSREAKAANLRSLRDAGVSRT